MKFVSVLPHSHLLSVMIPTEIVLKPDSQQFENIELIKFTVCGALQWVSLRFAKEA